jgi:hypothetical protein
VIPTFPRFEPLSDLDRRVYEASLVGLEPYSDFNFVTARTWDLSDSAAVAMLEDNLVLRHEDPTCGAPLVTFLGTTETTEVAHRLLDWLPSVGLPPILRRVPEQTVVAFEPSSVAELEVVEVRDNADYVYSLQDLANLTGRRFEQRRRGVRLFREAFPRHEVRELSARASCDRCSMEQLLERWLTSRDADGAAEPRELAAFRRCLEPEVGADLVYVGVLVEDELVGFTVNELVHAEFCMAHFVRALPGWRGLSELLEHETAKRLLARGCRWMNYQEDLGIPGLRSWKMSWRPVRFLRKFDVRRVR